MSEKDKDSHVTVTATTHSYNKWIDGVAAASGSTVAILILQPLDMVKVRLQGSGFGGGLTTGTTTGAAPVTSRYSLFTTINDIVRKEGVKQFWRGIGPTVLANGVAWGVYMNFYESFKQILGESYYTAEELKLQKHLQPSSTNMKLNFVAGVAAGISQLFITNPIFLIKTRMQLQTPGSANYYTGLIDGVQKTVRGEGFLGLYKGLVPGLWLTLHGGIQMSIYDACKHYFSIVNNKSVDKLGSTEIFIASSFSKLVASTVLYPLQVIKTRLQDSRNSDKISFYSGTIDTAKKIIKHEGLIGFYRGVIPNTLKVIPNSSITLLAYEEIKKFLNARQSN